jgi:hypothetical protein
MLNANEFQQGEAPLKVSNEDLEYWATVYLRLELLKRGYTFEDFLLATPQVREDAAVRAAMAVRKPTKRPGIVGRAPIEGPHGEPYTLTSHEQQVFRKAKLRSVTVIGNGRLIETRQSGFRDFIPLKKG